MMLILADRTSSIVVSRVVTVKFALALADRERLFIVAIGRFLAD